MSLINKDNTKFRIPVSTPIFANNPDLKNQYGSYAHLG